MADQTKTLMFHPDAVKLLDDLQERFGLSSHEEVIQKAIKILAVADKNPIFVFRNEQFIEIEIDKAIDRVESGKGGGRGTSKFWN